MLPTLPETDYTLEDFSPIQSSKFHDAAAEYVHHLSLDSSDDAGDVDHGSHYVLVALQPFERLFITALYERDAIMGRRCAKCDQIIDLLDSGWVSQSEAAIVETTNNGIVYVKLYDEEWEAEEVMAKIREREEVNEDTSTRQITSYTVFEQDDKEEIDEGYGLWFRWWGGSTVNVFRGKDEVDVFTMGGPDEVSKEEVERHIREWMLGQLTEEDE